VAVREEVLNVRLADALQSKGINARPEEILTKLTHNLLPDIIIDTQGVRVIIEARSHKRKLLSDAVARVTSGVCPVSIGLLYPFGLASELDIPRVLLSSAAFEADLVYYDRSGLKTQHASKISLNNLADMIQMARQVQVKDDLTVYHVRSVRTVIDAVVNDGLNQLNTITSKSLAAALSKKLNLTGQSDTKGLSNDLLRIAIFVLFDAMIFQGLVAERYPNDIQNVNANTKQGRRNFLLDNWGKILNIDYQQIFQISRDILDTIPNTEFWNKHLQEMARAASGVQGSGVLAKHDFMGRLFHKLLLKTTGEAFATNYTAIPTASLLARLAVNMDDRPLSSVEIIKKRTIGDFACGSGTLLSAAYTAYRDRYVSDTTERLDLVEFHKTLMEHCVWGLDVLDYAAHLTLTTLALHGKAAIFDRANIWRIPIGKTSRKNSPLYLGSLDLYSNSLTGWAFVEEEEGKSFDGSTAERINPPMFDLLLMNPPFSRSSGPKVTFAYDLPNKPELDKRMKSLAKQYGLGSIGTAGMGAYFVPLAIRYLKDGGRMGFVLPRSALSGVSWEDIRKAVTAECHLEMIISNFDPGHIPINEDGTKGKRIRGWAFSEETNIGEFLFIAKKTNDRQDAKTRFVNLFSFPANEFEAMHLADRILYNHKTETDAELLLDGIVIGTTYTIPQELLMGKNWLFPCAWASRDLNDFGISLSEERGLVPLGDLVISTGCDISPEKKMFEESSVQTAYDILWTHGMEQNSLVLHPSQVGWGSPKRTRKDSDDFFERHKGHLLLAERPHLKTTPTFAIYTKEAILSTPLWEICLKEKRFYKALTLWFNSTYGIFLYAMSATSSQGEILKLKKDQLEKLPVLNPGTIDLRAANALFEKLSTATITDLETSWTDAANAKGVRYEIDRFFSEYLVTKLTTAQYRLLATEPAVTYKKRSDGNVKYSNVKPLHFRKTA
jgi:hypothetical protein